MNISSNILYLLSEKFYHKRKPTVQNFSEINDLYFNKQYDKLVVGGLGLPLSIRGKNILEIGCGHGGNCSYFANNGASKVIGIDIDERRLEYARQKDLMNVSYLKMDAANINLPDNHLDIIFAPNVFEHFVNADKVLSECYRILKPGSKLVINPVSSIYSSTGAHLKHGIGLPWVNLFFSEKNICITLDKLSRKYPEIKKFYPGLKNNPTKIVDLRKSKDLNYLDYKALKKLFKKNNFFIEYQRIHTFPDKFFRIINSKFFKNSFFADVFSKSATFIIKKVNN